MTYSITALKSEIIKKIRGLTLFLLQVPICYRLAKKKKKKYKCRDYESVDEIGSYYIENKNTHHLFLLVFLIIIFSRKIFF